MCGPVIFLLNNWVHHYHQYCQQWPCDHQWRQFLILIPSRCLLYLQYLSLSDDDDDEASVDGCGQGQFWTIWVIVTWYSVTLPSHCPHDIAVLIFRSQQHCHCHSILGHDYLQTHAHLISHLQTFQILVDNCYVWRQPPTFLPQNCVLLWFYLVWPEQVATGNTLSSQPGSCCSWPLRLQRNLLPPSFKIQVPFPAPACAAHLDQMCPQCTGVSNDRLELEITMVLIIKHHDF